MRRTWFFLSLILALVTAIGGLFYQVITREYSQDQGNIVLVGMIGIFLAGLICFAILCYHRTKVYQLCVDIKNKDNRPIKYAILILPIIFIINICLTLHVFNKIDNPAYANLIKNANVIILLLLSILLFKVKINIPSIVGFIMCVLGISLIVLYN